MASPKERNYQVCDVDTNVSLTENGSVEGQEETTHCTISEQTEHERPLSDPPRIPSGDVIDCKNTLQSFDVRERNINAITAGEATNIDNGQASLIQPTLPNGQVIDFKNTMQSHDISSSNMATEAIPNIIPATRKHQEENNHNAASAEATRNENRNTTTDTISAVVREDVHAIWVQDVSAVAIVEGNFFTESPRPDRTIWWVIGALTIVTAIVVTGVCSAGKCSAQGDAFPLQSPTLSPVDVSVERAVSLFINEISFSKERIQVNGNNPESRALAWLIRDDPVFDSTDPSTLDSKTETKVSFRVRQRYPLLTLWFQQADESGAFVRSWVETHGWLDYDNECEWLGINCTTFDLGGNIGVQEVVTGIYLFNETTGTRMNFSGTIPPDMGLLTALTMLNFAGNSATGSIPESIGQCSLLQVFDVSFCSMTGILPSSIAKWTDIEYFAVTANSLRGKVPPITEQWLDVTFFDIGFNSLTGFLPEVGRWTSLIGLGLYGSSLNGTIPEAIGQWTDLEYLDLGDNNLNGTLPSSIGELTRLPYARFSGNNLPGTIPASVANWSQIQLASFEDNQLSGTVPSDFCHSFDNGTQGIYVDCYLPCECCLSVGECTSS